MYDSNNYSYSDGSFTPVEPGQQPPKKSGGNVGKIIAAVLAVVIVGGASGYGGAYLANSGKAEISTSATTENTEQTTSESKSQPTADASAEKEQAASILGNVNKSSSDTELSIKDAIEKAKPSVVFITSEFSTGSATGTGIILTSDGYIITNDHVIETQVRTLSPDNGYYSNDPFSSIFGNIYGNSYTTSIEKASEIIVTTEDGTEYTAEIIGCDSNTDLAILKVKADNLTAAEIGDSESLAMGDTAITLGYPLGLGLSASNGIISGLDKEMSVEIAGGSTTMTLIQTDAAINSGNSGGPLLNAAGQVIGITSSKIVGESIDGVGFAIPITDAMPILEELMTNGYVESTVPKIGITGTTITSAVKRYYNLPVDKGVLVATVEAGSAAAKAGLAEGDVIIAADGKDVDDMDTLVSLKNKHKAGETMSLTLARSDGNIDIELTLDKEE